MASTVLKIPTPEQIAASQQARDDINEHCLISEKIINPFDNHVVNIDVEAFREGTPFSHDQVISLFSKGNTAFYPVEIMASKIYNYHMVTNSSEKYDGYIETSSSKLGNNMMTVGVKSLKIQDGVKFQQNQLIGRGLVNKLDFEDKYLLTYEAILKSSALIDWQIVVDLNYIPFIYFMPIKTGRLQSIVFSDYMYHVRNNKRGTMSFGYKKYYELIQEKSLEDMIKNGDFIEIPYEELCI